MTVSVSTRARTPGAPAQQRLAHMADIYVERMGNIGVLVAIDLPGRDRVYVESGHRDLARTTPIAKGDLFQIGSQTKTVVAWAMLLLQRDGKLTLDDPVVRHLNVPIDARITIKHLLMNTCGLGEYTEVMANAWLDAKVDLPPRDLLAFALPQGQIFPPGERFDYCNTGWLVAAMVIDALTGSYPDFVQTRIFGPLCLGNSFVGAAGWPRDRAASGYFRTARSETVFDTNRDTSFSWAYGAGDVISNCDDMLDLFSALLDPKNATGVSLADLTQETALPGPRPKFTLSLGVEYAYGLERRHWAGRPVWGHPGRTMGYGASTWIDPELKLTVTTCVTSVQDMTEPPEMAFLRYPGSQLFTLALATGYALAGV